MSRLETRVTYLELREPGRAQQPPADRSVVLLKVERIPLPYYRFLYDSVGRRHHWTSRLLPDDKLAEEVHRAGTEVYVLHVDGAPAGWFEIDMTFQADRTRIVHFGVMPEFQGQRLARYLLSEATSLSRRKGAASVVLETNTLDHPAAFPLYRSFGFTPLGARIVSTPAIEAG